MANIDLISLLTTINSSGFQKSQPAAYQTIVGLINYLLRTQRDLNSITDIITAAVGAGILTWDDESQTFKASKKLTAGTGIAIDNTAKGVSTISATGSSGSNGTPPIFIGMEGNDDIGFPIPGPKGDAGNTGPQGPTGASGSAGNAPLTFDDNDFSEPIMAAPFVLNPTKVTPGQYGDNAHVAQVTVDQYGRLTIVSSVAITTGGIGASDPIQALSFAVAF